MENEFDTLYATVVDRKSHAEPNSYTAYLYNKGIEKILKKVGEECTEVIIASMKEDNNEEIANEIGDLLYHVFVLMADRGVTLDDVKEVLAGRSKKTGNLKPERKKIEQY